MSSVKSTKTVISTLDDKCSRCPGDKCCNYITQSIDTPRSISDFDHLIWQLAHKNIKLYKDEDGWFLLLMSLCQFLQKDGRCGIYETRPQLCRDYSNDYCEFDEPAEKSFKHYFRNYKELDAYCRKRFKRWDKRFSKQ